MATKTSPNLKPDNHHGRRPRSRKFEHTHASRKSNSAPIINPFTTIDQQGQDRLVDLDQSPIAAEDILNSELTPELNPDEQKKGGGWYNPLTPRKENTPKGPDVEKKEAEAGLNDGQSGSVPEAERSIANNGKLGKGYLGFQDENEKGLRSGAKMFLRSRGFRIVGGGGAFLTVTMIFMFMAFGAGSELIGFRENLMNRSPFAKILNFSTDKAAQKSFHKSLRQMRAGDPKLKIDTEKFSKKFREAGFTVEFDNATPPEKPKLLKFAYGDRELNLNDTDSKRAMRNFIDEADGATRLQIKKSFNQVQRNEARTFKGKAARRIYKTLKVSLTDFTRRVTTETPEDSDSTRLAKRDAVNEAEARRDAGINRTGGQPEANNTDEDGTRNTSDDASNPKDSDGLTLDLPEEVDTLIEESRANPGVDVLESRGLGAGTAESLSGVIGETIGAGANGVSESSKTSILTALRANPKIAARAVKFSKLAGLISITEPFRIACRVKGTIAFVAHVQNVVLAAEMAKFAIKILSVADHQKAGLINSEGLRLVMNYLKSGEGYISSGGVQWLLGNTGATVGSAALSQYSVSRKPSGVLQSIVSFLDTIPLTNPTACKIYNNGVVQIATAIIGGILAVFSGGSTAAAQAGIGFAIGLLEEAVFIIATPILLKAGMQQVASWYEAGDEAGNMFASGFGSFLGSIGSVNGLLLSKTDDAAYMSRRAEAQYRENMANRSVFERYLDIESGDSLLSKVAFSLPANTNQLATKLGSTGRLAFAGPATLSQEIADSLLNSEALAETNPQCNDPKANELGYSTDPFCNPLVATAPDLNLDQTEAVLTRNNMIDGDGRPVAGSEYESFIKDCLSGRTGLAYSADVAQDGTEDINSSECTKTGRTLGGTEPQLIVADAPMTDTRPWYAKLFDGGRAYAQEEDRVVTPSSNQLYAAWFNHREANVEGLVEEINNDYDFETPTTTTPVGNNNLYVIGDSLTVGMRDSGQLEAKLEALGWNVLKINATAGEDLDWGIEQLNTDASIIASAGAVLVGLGTNNVGNYPDQMAQFNSQLEQINSAINPEGASTPKRVFWTDFYGEGTLTTQYGEFDLEAAYGAADGLNASLNSFATGKGIRVINWSTSTEASTYVPNNDVHPNGRYPEMADFIASQVGAPPRITSSVGTPVSGAAAVGAFKMNIVSEPATECISAEQPGAKELQRYVNSQWGGGTGWIQNCRNQSTGTGRLSVHSQGRAVDSFFDANNPTQLDNGNSTFEWLLTNAEAIGVQYIKFWRVQWSPGRGISCVTSASDQANHSTHIHFEVNWAGANRQTPYFTNGVSSPAQVNIDQNICPIVT